MSKIDHNPAQPGSELAAARIGVRAIISPGDRRPQVALRIPGLSHQLCISADDAAVLAGRLISTAHMARYDAAVYVTIEQTPVSADVRAAILGTLVAARERLGEQGLGSTSRPQSAQESGR